MQQKKYKDAEAALRRAVTLDPGQPDAHYQLGRLYQALGNKVESEKELVRARELHEKADESLMGKMKTSPPAIIPRNDE
jgi:Flp pilus assembly protein TadD